MAALWELKNPRSKKKTNTRPLRSLRVVSLSEEAS